MIITSKKQDQRLHELAPPLHVEPFTLPSTTERPPTSGSTHTIDIVGFTDAEDVGDIFYDDVMALVRKKFDVGLAEQIPEVEKCRRRQMPSKTIRKKLGLD